MAIKRAPLCEKHKPRVYKDQCPKCKEEEKERKESPTVDTEKKDAECKELYADANQDCIDLENKLKEAEDILKRCKKKLVHYIHGEPRADILVKEIEDYFNKEKLDDNR